MRSRDCQPESKKLTVLYIVPHGHELRLQFFHLVAPFILHLNQRGKEPIPTQQPGHGAQKHRKLGLYTHFLETNSYFTLTPVQSSCPVVTDTSPGCVHV